MELSIKNIEDAIIISGENKKYNFEYIFDINNKNSSLSISNMEMQQKNVLKHYLDNICVKIEAIEKIMKY